MNNCCLVRTNRNCMVIDPSIWPNELLARIESEKLTVQKILLTHGHADHFAGTIDLRKINPKVKVFCPADDVPMLTDPKMNGSAFIGFPMGLTGAITTIHPGEEIKFYGSTWKVLDSSGHSPGGVSFYCPQLSMVITGDSLFANTVGRTDMSYSNSQKLLQNIRNNLLTVPPETRVIPGHGEETTIGREAAHNPHLKRSNG